MTAVLRQWKSFRQWRMGLFAMGYLALTGSLLLHLWFRLQVVHFGYELSRAAQEKSRLEQESRALKIDIAGLSASERMKTYLQESGSWSPPAAQDVIHIAEVSP